jgi:hypothetical protein
MMSPIHRFLDAGLLEIGCATLRLTNRAVLPKPTPALTWTACHRRNPASFPLRGPSRRVGHRQLAT